MSPSLSLTQMIWVWGHSWATAQALPRSARAATGGWHRRSGTAAPSGCALSSSKTEWVKEIPTRRGEFGRGDCTGLERRRGETVIRFTAAVPPRRRTEAVGDYQAASYRESSSGSPTDRGLNFPVHCPEASSARSGRMLWLTPQEDSVAGRSAARS